MEIDEEQEESQSPLISQAELDPGNEALKYLAGYLAHKFRFQFPCFGNKTNTPSGFQQLSFPWIAALTRGGLTFPTLEFVSKVQQLEETFISIHGDSLKKGPGLIKNASELMLRKHQSLLPDEVIKAFVKTRTFIRIKELNHRLRRDVDKAKQRNEAKMAHFKK